jgi:hypothetical protein
MTIILMLQPWKEAPVGYQLCIIYRPDEPIEYTTTLTPSSQKLKSRSSNIDYSNPWARAGAAVAEEAMLYPAKTLNKKNGKQHKLKMMIKEKEEKKEVQKEGHKRQASNESGPAYSTRRRTAVAGQGQSDGEGDGEDDDELPENINDIK